MNKTVKLKEPNGEKEKHWLPNALQERIEAEFQDAQNRIAEINQNYRTRVSLLIEGYAASFGVGKQYSLSADRNALIEI